MSTTPESPVAKPKVIGVKEVVALLCIASIGIGLWQLHQSLPWIWVGAAGLFLVWQSLRHK